MPFWSRKPKEPSYDDRFKERIDTIDRLLKELEESFYHSSRSVRDMSDEELNVNAGKSNEILRLIQVDKAEWDRELDRNPDLNRLFPNAGSTFDRRESEAEWYLQTIERIQDQRELLKGLGGRQE